jgi:hypothetical protein
MTLFPWKGGKTLVWDATCVDNLAPSYVQHSDPDFAVASAETKKKRKYSCLAERYIVIPVAFSTLGRWGSEGLTLITAIGRLIQEKTFERRATSFLKQRLSMAIQRGNAASVFGTVAPSRALDEVYYL